MEVSFKRKRGGIRQRLDATTETLCPELDSCLANFLLKQFSWGCMSPQLLQQIASLAMEDINNAVRTGCSLRDLGKLSKLGGAGHLSNHIHRDIMQFQSKSLLPNGFEILMPFSN